MKRISKIFLLVFLISIGVQILDMFLNSSVLSFLNLIVCLPISLYDRSYPFYAEGSIYFGLFLFLFNCFLQTLFLESIVSIFTKTK